MNQNHQEKGENVKRSSTQPKDSLRPITIRISTETYNTVSSLASEYRVKKADILRMAIDSSLEKYLEQIRYVNEEQGQKINRNIIKLGNLLIDIRDQLRRIGINYNREVRLRNIDRKKKALEAKEHASINSGDITTVKQLLEEKEYLEKEIQVLNADKNMLNKDELDNMIKRIEIAIKKQGTTYVRFCDNN